MQKVVGSSPIIRSQKPAGNGGFSFSREAPVDAPGQRVGQRLRAGPIGRSRGCPRKKTSRREVATKRQNGRMARPSALTPERQEAVERALPGGSSAHGRGGGRGGLDAHDQPLAGGGSRRSPPPVRCPGAGAGPYGPRTRRRRRSRTWRIKVLVSVVLRAARDDWHAAIALLRWREMRRRTLR